MKKWLFLLLLFPIIGVAQTYQYIGVEDGLSNRRVYCIQKDKIGYMWFLTHEGIDRYNGKEFKQYKLMDNGIELNSLLNLNWLYIDTEGILWEIGKKGKYSAMIQSMIILYVFTGYHQRKIMRIFRLPSASAGLTSTTTSGCVTKKQFYFIIPRHKKSSGYKTSSMRLFPISSKLTVRISSSVPKWGFIMPSWKTTFWNFFLVTS